MNVVEFNMNSLGAIAVTIMHHQWMPDMIMLEEGVSVDTKNILVDMGHQMAPPQYKSTIGELSSIMLKNGIMYGAADPRSMDAAAIGY